MGQYLDFQQEAWDAWEARQHRRERLVHGIRGLLRERQRPRWLAAWHLVLALPIGLLVCAAAAQCGISVWGAAPALGLLAMWPIYVWLSGRASERFAYSTDFSGDLAGGIVHDETSEAIANAPRFSRWQRLPETSPLKMAMQGCIDGAIEGAAEGCGAGGIMALPMLVALGCLTGGTILIWHIIRQAPTLLAETIIDGPLARLHPALVRKVETAADWKPGAFRSTGMYFVSLAVVVALLGAGLRGLYAEWAMFIVGGRP